jgi:hypothetical protein
MQISTVKTKFLTNQKEPEISVNISKIREIHKISSNLADLTEDILEERASFNPNFIKGLNVALKEVKTGKAKKAGSLMEL